MMAAIAVTMFVGITLPRVRHRRDPVGARHDRVADRSRGVRQRHPLYYGLQVVTMAILVLAANTAYADFPRLASIVARDRYMPRQFMNQGDKLAFSNGIIALSVPPAA